MFSSSHAMHRIWQATEMKLREI